MEKGKNSNNLSLKVSENNENPSRTSSKKILTKKDLSKLDEYIQQCLNMFKFVDPKPEFYEATGKEKDLIISHKSTIPDLVIWNKAFNKNECFQEANLNKPNPFPRFQFFLRIKSTKSEKEKKKEKKNEKKEKKNEKKEKNKKKEKKKNINNKENNLIDNNNNINLNNNINNIINNNNNTKQLIKPEITNLNDLDLNKITDYNPYHKNNPYKKMNMDDNLNKIIPNEIGLSGNNNIINNTKNSFLSSKLNETRVNKDLNLSIKNNQYIQNYPLNNNNNDVSKLINMNNYPFEYQNNNNGIYSAINYYKNQNGWMIVDTLNGNFVETPFNSFGLYQYLSTNSNNLKGYKIFDKKFNIKLSGDILFNILSQYFESDIKNNQIQKMMQNINLSEIPDFKTNDINMNMNLNQFNINNIDSGFNLNSLNKINNKEYQYNNMQSKLLNNLNTNNNNPINPNEINNISDFFSSNNNNNKNNSINNFNYYQKNQSQSFNSNSNSNFFNNNYNHNFDFKLNQDNSNSKLNNNNNINIENQNQPLENELFSAENYFNKELTNKNNSQNKNISEQDQDILDDKNDNEEYNNINNLIFYSTKNINSNSKSNNDINDDINNNEPNQFDSNNDYQYDNYNAIFSQYSNENNNEGNL